MEQPPQWSEPPAQPSGRPTTSLFARLLNVFAVPGEVFEEVKAARHSVANWIVPALLYGLVGAVSVVLIFSQPAILQQMRESTAKRYDDQVSAGKMSRADADKAIDTSEKFMTPTVLKIFGSVGAVIGSFVGVFWWAFLLWLIGSVCLKTPLDFMKLVEVSGLACAISTLEGIIRMLLVVSLSNPLASPSLAMLLKNPDPKNKLFALLSLVNIMTFWALAVRAIGLARLSGVPARRTLPWVFAAWVIMSAVLFGFAATVGRAFGGAG